MPLSSIPLPPPPLIHGKNSKTFSSPPMDGSLTVPQLIDWQAEHSPNHPLFVFDDGPNKVWITWSKVRIAIERAARIVRALNVPRLGTSSKIIGILASIDSISYFTLFHGIMRAGYIPFALSPRNSPSSVAHLLTKTNATHVFVSGDPNMQALWAASEKVLHGGGQLVCKAVMTPFYDMLYEDKPDGRTIPAPGADLNSTGMLLHSSGSTAFPKPISILHRSIVEFIRIPSYGELDLCSKIIGATTLPMFHALGSMNAIQMIGCGAILSVFKPEERPSFPSPERVIESLLKTPVYILFTMPSFLEAWSLKSEWIEVLKRSRIVAYSGGPLSKVVGDSLAAAGVPVYPFYGITETAGVNIFIPAKLDLEAWEYWRFSKHIHVSLKRQEDSDAVEFRALRGPTHTPSGINSEFDGEMGLSTSDLLLEHPTKKGYYSIYGRADDQLMLSTGEKTNPGPLEAIISRDPLIQGSVMFGRGKPHNGVIITPAPHLSLDISDKGKVAAYIDSIWASVQLANEYAPSHSRLFREMIILAKPEKPFTFTGKGSIRKSAVIKDYDEEIETVYKTLEKAVSSKASVNPPTQWTKESLHTFVRDVVTGVMGAKIGDDQDIFQNGSDSLQATFMRNSIVTALRDTKAKDVKGELIDTSLFSSGLIYQAPTIDLLAEALYGLFDPSSVSSTTDFAENKIAELRAFVDRYASDLPIHKPTDPAPGSGPGNSEVIVVTGTTGALGTAILAQLTKMSTVVKVYALNRVNSKGGGKTLRKRQEESLIERGYDPKAVLGSGKVELYEIDPISWDLGLDGYAYETIRHTATTIIHTAWRVDFNLAVSSFEPLFQGLRCLVDLSLSSYLPTPPKILFASSVSVLGTITSDAPAAEVHVNDPRTVLNAGGYGESKWVAEQILARVAQETPLKPVVVRVGQLSGGKNGSWNTSEWIPAIVKSGEVVRALPAVNDRVSWLPMNVAASAFIDFRNTTSGLVHLSHPYPTTWTEIFSPIAKALRVPLVPYSQWLELLEKDLANPSHSEVEAATANPDGMPVTKAREAMGVPVLSNVKAVKASPALRRENLRSLGKEDALGWLRYWREKGFVTSELHLEEDAAPWVGEKASIRLTTTTTEQVKVTPPEAEYSLPWIAVGLLWAATYWINV
ncbi:acetyl-CoA synthetase-like protein [Cantharellus anzutake]|uniref:acetyl-CoA synthetase-like protein n=1 Tax=Cantharellus anzutake TaxID=1750568 RepID=UPI001905A101|nr:acetyl-CoA synthetase-like protein [Cantharellus anzutake]KAF8315479.1 acetyl-CoA synthetase-like protein [Cantharellus anzutake]